MKLLLKILAGIIVLVLAAAILLPIIYKDDIVVAVKSKINDEVNAQVSFGDFSLSLIRSFPNLNFSMENVLVMGVDTFKNDTLANISELTLIVDIMSVIEGKEIKIKSIIVNKADLNIKVLANGKANYDIAKVDTSTVVVTDTAVSKFNLAIKKYEFIESNLRYTDASLAIDVIMKNLNHSGSGDFTQDLFILNTLTTASSFTFMYDGIAYLNKVKLEADVPLEMDMLNSKYTFKENKFKVNELLIAFNGYVSMPDTNIDMDLQFDAEKSEFKNFLSLIPAIYSSSFDKLEANGNFALKGFYKGRMNALEMPGFGLNVLIENGAFRYPDLPTGINNVQMKLQVDNPDGVVDHTIVDLQNLHLEFGSEPFDALLLLKTPESDPDIKTSIKGKIDLGNILKIIPIEDTRLSGIINTNLQAAGKLSTIEKGNYESFNANGFLSISNLEYSSKEYPELLQIKSVNFDFSPRYVEMKNLRATYEKSNISAAGRIENYIAYVLKDATLKANLKVDVDQYSILSSADTSGTSDTATTSTAIEIPANIDFTLNSNVQKIMYDDMLIENFVGNIQVKDARLNFTNVSMQTLDAKMSMTGFYDTKDPKAAYTSMNFGIQGMDIQKAFQTFNTVQKLAPLAEKSSGKFNAQLQMNTKMGADMSPIYESLQGEGNVELLQTKIKGSKTLSTIGEKLKTDKLDELALNDTKILFSIVNGRVIVKPVDIIAGPLSMNLAGSSGLDQSIDYTMKFKMPKGFLGGTANQVLDQLAGVLNKNGANYKADENLLVNALVGGVVSKPTVKLSLADGGKSVKNAITDVANAKKAEAIAKAREEARKQADQILANAQQQSDRVKQEARKLAEQTKKEGYAQADRLVKEAKNPIAKEAAKIAAEKMKKETDAKANKIIAEGDKQADAIMAKARAEAARLIG
jgi:vacuolar-type H+-ATPase subunit H/ribosomal protein L15